MTKLNPRQSSHPAWEPPVIARGVRLTGAETFLGEDAFGHSMWLVRYVRPGGIPDDGGGTPMFRCGQCGGTSIGPTSDPCPGYTPWSDEAHAASAARVGRELAA